MECESAVLRRGPTHHQLSTANNRLSIFAANGFPSNLHFSSSPPPYRSPSSTPCSDDLEVQQYGDTEESRRRYLAEAEVFKQTLREDPYAFMTAEERKADIEHQHWLKKERLAREAQEKRQWNEFWASRNFSSKNPFGVDSVWPGHISKAEEDAAHVQNGNAAPVRPRRRRGRPRGITTSRTGDPRSQLESSARSTSLRTEQQSGPRRSARIAAQAAARTRISKSLTVAVNSKVSKPSQKPQRRRGGRGRG